MYLVRLFLILCGVWLGAFVALSARPASSLAEARGLYREQGGTQPYRWTSNRVDIPIHGRSGPTQVELALAAVHRPGRPRPQITLATEVESLATFTVSDQVRRYRLLFSPSSSTLLLHTAVNPPSQDDSRWLGVQVFAIAATPSGLPLQLGVQALLLALAAVLLALAATWSVRRGHGVVVGLMALALLLRVFMLQVAPPGFNQDEVVSAVDAWHLVHTGRDHLGNVLPLGAFEAFGDWISPLLTYLELPVVALFGPTPLGARLVTALLGTLAVLATYRLALSLHLPLPAAVFTAFVVAISPWQIFLSRYAIPPALVPVSWTVCLWAALLLVQRGGRNEAVRLALVAGVALYAYPTMKLAVPLLVGLAAALALARHGGAAARQWLRAALLLMLLWLPSGSAMLLNPASNTRLNQAMLRAESRADWLAKWWAGYSAYANPDYFYVSGDGDQMHGVPGRGVQLAAEAPLLFVGLVMLGWRCCIIRRRGSTAPRGSLPYDWWFLAGALLIAPLPASLTQASAHSLRGATVAPLYALLVGIGAAVLWQATARLPYPWLRSAIRAGGAGALLAVLAWQGSQWFQDYVEHYSPQVAWFYQDGLLETMERVIGHAPRFDEVWIDTDGVNEAYVYLLAAHPMPPAEAQARLRVTRRPRRFNLVTSIGRYRFDNLTELPRDLPILEAVPDRFGGPAFVVQEWRTDGKQVLVVRRMK